MRKPAFAYAKTKTQISFAVTAKLISVFVFATRIVQSLYFLYTKFQASSHLVWLYSLVYVRPGRKPRRPVFSQQGSYHFNVLMCNNFWADISIGAWWLSGRASDSGGRGRGFETYLRHVVSLSKTLYSQKVMVIPRKQ